MQLSPKSIVRDGYDRVSHAYHSGERHAFESPYDQWLRLLTDRLARDDRVLDLGCGVGLPIAAALANHYSVLGVDISPVQIERARSLVPNADFICRDMYTADFESQSFHAVVAFYSLIHLPLEEQPVLLRRVGNWLKPSGWFIATLGLDAWTGTENDWLGVAGAEMYWNHADAMTYWRWLQDAGLEVVDEHPVDDGGGGRHQLFVAQKAM